MKNLLLAVILSIALIGCGTVRHSTVKIKDKSGKPAVKIKKRSYWDNFLTQKMFLKGGFKLLTQKSVVQWWLIPIEA